MHGHAWLAFTAAAATMGAIPGPGVVSIVGYALGSGRRTALAAVAGMATGNAITMAICLFGVGALLATSALALAIIKWIGAIYLITLGVRTMIQARVTDAGEQPQQARPISARTAFTSTVTIGICHPKTIVFFVAFVPQFIDASRPYVPQAASLIVIFCTVVAATDTAYALAASKLGRTLRKRRTILWAQRAGGGVLIAAGMAAAASHP